MFRQPPNLINKKKNSFFEPQHTIYAENVSKLITQTCLSNDERVFAVWVEVDVGDDGEDPLVAAGPHSPVAL